MKNSIWVHIFIEKEYFNYVEFEVLPQPGDLINIWESQKKITTLQVKQRIINDEMLNKSSALICSKI